MFESCLSHDQEDIIMRNKKIITPMIDLYDKLPDGLTIGNQYTKKELDKLFNTSEIEKIYGGIGKINNYLILLITLDKTYTAELPKKEADMTREEKEEHNYRHLDYFDIEENIFCWDGPTNMNLDSPLIKDFTSKVYQCLLFVREYYHKNDYEFENKIINDKYFYCGKIRYQKHIDTKIKHFISSLEDEPNKKLYHLYSFIPPDLEERKKEFNVLKEKDNNDFLDLVEQEESRTHERKSTFSGNPEVKKGYMVENNLKAIAGFLNERGGNLMIGIEDNGDITGIEKDYNYKNNDHFERHILLQMRKFIDKFELIEKYIKFQFGTVTPTDKNSTKKIICRINCKPLPNDMVAYVKGKLYLRVGPITNELSVKEAVSWLKRRQK